MVVLEATFSVGALAASIEALSVLQMLTFQFPFLTYTSRGAPTYASVENVLEKSNALENPVYIEEYVKRNNINAQTDEHLSSAWENARKSKEYAEKTKIAYQNLFTPIGIDLRALSTIKTNRNKAATHYKLAMQESRLLYKEIVHDILRENRKLNYLGANNYTGPSNRVYEKTENIIKKLNKGECGPERDISTQISCLTEKIKTSGDLSPNIFNKITGKENSMVSNYHELKQDIEKSKRNMKITLNNSKSQYESISDSLNEQITYLKSHDVFELSFNPGIGQKGEIKPHISGSPREQLIKIKNIHKESESSFERANRIEKNKRENYMSKAIEKSSSAVIRGKRAEESALNLKERIKKIQIQYEDKIEKEKQQLEKTLTTQYLEEINRKTKKALNQPTYGKRILSLKQTLEFTEKIRQIDKKGLITIHREIEKLLGRLDEYKELGYSLPDKRDQLEKLKEVKDPEMFLTMHETLENIQESIKIRLSPLERKIKNRRQEAERYLEAGKKISKEPSTQNQINVMRLNELEEEYNKAIRQKPLENPVQKLESYENIIRAIRSTVDKFKSSAISENTRIEVQDTKTPKCNEKIHTQITIHSENIFNIPLYNVHVEKDIDIDGKKTISHYINILSPRETKKKQAKVSMIPYTCNVVHQETISANEDHLTQMKKIEVTKHTENQKVNLGLQLPNKIEFLHLPPNTRETEEGIILKTPWKRNKVTLTYREEPKLDVEEEKININDNKIQREINIINNGEQLSNLTLTRTISPAGEVNSNYPVEVQDNQIKITIPKLKNKATVKMSYYVESWLDEANAKMSKIRFLETTKKVNEQIEEQLNNLESLFKAEKYKGFVEEAPDLIKSLENQPKPSESFYGSENRTKPKNTTNSTDKPGDLFMEEYRYLEDRINKTCVFIDCENVKQDLNALKESQNPEDLNKIQKDTQKLEEQARRRITGEENNLDELFETLERAFKRTHNYNISTRYLPYTPEDYEAIEKRKENLKDDQLSLSLTKEPFNELTEKHTLSYLKQKIEKRDNVEEDAKEILETLNNTAINELRRARDTYSDNPKQSTKNHLTEAKQFQERGQYLNSIMASRSVIESTEKASDSSLPIKYIVGGLIISATVLYVLKKPSKKKNNEDNKLIKLKRAK